MRALKDWLEGAALATFFTVIMMAMAPGVLDGNGFMHWTTLIAIILTGCVAAVIGIAGRHG